MSPSAKEIIQLDRIIENNVSVSGNIIQIKPDCDMEMMKKVFKRKKFLVRYFDLHIRKQSPDGFGPFAA